VWLATFILHYLFPGISVLNITIAFEYRLLYLNGICLRKPFTGILEHSILFILELYYV
jgi:hypothetical protein